MIGRKLRNRYEIMEHLGDGSTATVYKALDERLGREIAVKLLLPHVRETTRKRFLQEATSAAMLNHTNITAIYDIDEEDDRPYLLMEYVEGVSLAYYIPSDAPRLVDLGKQIAGALQYAHERQIIHRDIKPANIKVTSKGIVKIMDLGLALPNDAKRVTAHGMVIGTPAYLSPEQAQGLKLDHRTDIYSLGIVLYEMATGQLPFNADDIGALLLQQVKQSPPPPRIVNSDIPPALEAAILKTLEKNPDRRYQSAAALFEALDSVLQTNSAQLANTDDANEPVNRQTKISDTVNRQRTLRVILADDHTLLRKSLAGLLETHDDFVVVAEAGDGESALQQTVSILPDVLVLDLNMPGRNGIDILPEVRSQAPKVKVLVLTGRDEDVYIVRALRAGAHGYILKSANEDEMIDAIGKVVQGQLVLGRGIAEKIVGGMLSPNTPDDEKLNDTDQKILLYVAAGYDNAEIARRLDIPLPELIEMFARVMNITGADDRHAAALTALRTGQILLEDLHSLD
jgi:serine/threonine protein kinase/DNA-binding CsgD family transcriptional regulator